MTALAWLRRRIGRSDLSLGDELTSRLSQLENAFQRKFGVKPSLTQRARAELAVRRSLLPLFKRVLKRVEPEAVVTLVSYSTTSEILVEACQTLSIPTIELQHGVIHPYHPGYSFPGPQSGKETFPDHLFTYGPAWAEQEGLELPDTEVHDLGFAHLEEVQEDRTGAERDQIVVISQPGIGEDLAELSLDLARSSELDWRVVFRPHPKEMNDWTERYPEIRSSSVDVEDGDLYRTLRASKAQVGHNSTVLYEGLALGLRTFVLEEPGREVARPLIESGQADLVSDSSDITDGIHQGGQRPRPETQHRFFQPGARSRFDELIERVIG